MKAPGASIRLNDAAPTVRGRGAAQNPTNRFEKIHLEQDEDWNAEEDAAPRTQFFRDTTQTFITQNNSPDVGFETSINPYRGCEHGCIYCFARPTHEYLGFSAGLDFESRIMVKENGPELLRKELSARKWKPQTIVMSGVTDCYQPIERKLKITRRCLEVLAEFRNPVAIITKNHLVTRDIDFLGELARHNAAVVNVSITTLDATLTPRLEPRASLPNYRLAAVRELTQAGVPVNVMVAPVIPCITDHEMPRILEAAAEAGAVSAGYVPVRLPWAVAPLFENWVARHFPDRKEKVLNRIREMRGGKLNDPNFGSRMRGEGIFAEQIHKMFEVACRRAGLPKRHVELSTSAFRVPDGPQLSLFNS
ncbi:MAG TPA: PA0069 family radical SAM protein [Candidatus Limnocylindria bacterium]|nr:PA0069 family radical SAM protein [Candidatus Limnocylindria bacterium]